MMKDGPTQRIERLQPPAQRFGGEALADSGRRGAPFCASTSDMLYSGRSEAHRRAFGRPQANR